MCVLLYLYNFGYYYYYYYYYYSSVVEYDLIGNAQNLGRADGMKTHI